MLFVKTEFHSFTKGEVKGGHGDEKDEDDEEGFEYPVVKTESFFLSFNFFPRCKRHSSILASVRVESAIAHIVFLELTSLTEDMRAT